jgi:Leu/Phe-tRNA-protein transferase
MELFKMGRLHTVEVWTSLPAPLLGKERGVIPLSLPRRGVRGEVERLIGGLYGLTFGAVFCGESMFSRAPYTSQIALVHLVERLRMKGFELLDAQMPSEHLEQFGLYECSQEDYLTQFRAAAALGINW